MIKSAKVLCSVLHKGGDYPLQILDGRESFYQWDINQQITGDFKAGDEIHFYNIKLPTALVVIAYESDGKVVADVPNILLQSSLPITVYRYINGSDTSFTIDEHTFTVIQRAKPDDYVYSETEVLTITTAVNKALEDAKNSGDFDGADGKDGKDGKDGHTPKKGVDYYTETEKQELVDEINKTVTGDIETALDGIIAIQSELIGGDTE
jgi:hypothetical protein